MISFVTFITLIAISTFIHSTNVAATTTTHIPTQTTTRSPYFDITTHPPTRTTTSTSVPTRTTLKYSTSFSPTATSTTIPQCWTLQYEGYHCKNKITIYDKHTLAECLNLCISKFRYYCSYNKIHKYCGYSSQCDVTMGSYYDIYHYNPTCKTTQYSSTTTTSTFNQNQSPNWDILEVNWIYTIIGLILILFCCIGCISFLIFLCKRSGRKNSHEYNYGDIQPQTKQPVNTKTPVVASHHSMPSNSIATQPQHIVVVHTIPNKTQVTQHAYSTVPIKTQKEEKPNVTKFKEKEAPPPYNPHYDKQQVASKYDNMVEMEHVNNNNIMLQNGLSETDALLKDNNMNSIENIRNDNVLKKDNHSKIVSWNKNDILKWINSINISEQWKEIVVIEIKNGNYNGNDLMNVKSGKDVAKLFGIENTMLCSRLWKELKKIN